MNNTIDITQHAIKNTYRENHSLPHDAVPVIYINSDAHLSVIDRVITLTDTSITLSGKTILDIVNELVAAGVQAYVSSPRVAIMPAEMLLPMHSITYGETILDASPYDLGRLTPTSVLNMVPIDGESVAGATIMSLSERGHDLSYAREGNTLYFNKGQEEAVLEYSYNIRSYMLYWGMETLHSASDIIKSDPSASISRTTLEIMNTMNRNDIR